MSRLGTLVITAMLVMSLAGMSSISFAQNDAAVEQESDVAPGERLSGVIGVQQAEIEGEIAERRFGIRIAQAATNESKADIVDGQLGDIEERIAELEARKEALDESREAGEISEGQYNAEIARIGAERATAERLANQSMTVAQGLSAEILAERGIDITRIEELRTNASELGGPEVAEIARSIAGSNVGVNITEPPADVDVTSDDPGPPDDTLNETVIDDDPVDAL